MLAPLRLKLQRIALALSVASAFPLAAQESTAPLTDAFTLPTTQGCSNQIAGTKSKIYIANFLVTYGKKTMGRLIADNIAFRFESDERFDLIPRKTIDKEMSVLFKKKLKPEEYLNLAVSLAAEHKADCVIFGKIGKKGSQISFMVRMAAVSTGENKIKVDEDVDRKEASAFFERTGESLVSYFQAAPAAPVAVEPPKRESSSVVLTFWGGYNVFLPNTAAQTKIDGLKTLPNATSSLGGFSGGADLWIRATDGVDLGIGVSYLSVLKYKYTATISGNSISEELNAQYLPVMAQLRFISGVGLYATFGFGYFVGMADYNYTVNGSKLLTASTAESVFGLNAGLGWQIKLGSSVVLDIGAKFWHLLEKSDGESITPFAGFGFRF